MADVIRYVLDTSVALRWYLKDEEYRDNALMVADDFAMGRIRLLAPSMIYAEVVSGIRNATRVPRISDADGWDAINDFLSLDLRVTAFENLLPDAYALSGRLWCSVYDAYFLALGELAECQVVYADNRLRRGLGGRFPRALWIEDYEPAPAP